MEDLKLRKTHVIDRSENGMCVREGGRGRTLSKNIIQPNAATDTETKEFLTSTKPTHWNEVRTLGSEDNFSIPLKEFSSPQQEAFSASLQK